PDCRPEPWEAARRPVGRDGAGGWSTHAFDSRPSQPPDRLGRRGLPCSAARGRTVGRAAPISQTAFLIIVPLRYKVPVRLTEMLLVVSVTFTFVKTTVIGGAHSGLKAAVKESENSALPLWTGNSPWLERDSLFALGCFSPLLMHSALALTAMCTCS